MQCSYTFQSPVWETFATELKTYDVEVYRVKMHISQTYCISVCFNIYVVACESASSQ